jgi:hypothetical protein
MDFYVSARTTQEQIRAEQMRRQAVLTSGYSFIVLQLLDNKKSRVSGVETLIPRKAESMTNPGMIEFTFSIATGPMVFESDLNRGGVMTAYLLDTDWNRAILGTHFNLNFWRIVDVITGTREDVVPITTREIVEDVRKRSANSAKAALRKPLVAVPELLPVMTKSEVKDIPDEDLDASIERLTKEKAKRDKLKANAKEMAKYPVGVVRKPEAPVSAEPEGLVTVKA